MTEVDAIVREMDDKDALAFVLLENLHHSGISPADEAAACAAMRDELAMDEEEIARRISRSVEWVRNRQLMLELGDEVMQAVQQSDPERRLSIGAVEEILSVEESLRPAAVQMVLHPVFQVPPLSPKQARAILREHLVEPSLRERAWNAAKEKVVKEYRARFREMLGKDGSDGLHVLACEWKDRQREAVGALPAEDRVADHERAESAPEPLLWLHLAVRHGLAVKVIPGSDDGESRAMVSASMLRMAEQALEESGGEAWIVTKKTPAAPKQDEDEDDETDEERTIGMDHHAWLDLTIVHELKAWADTAADDAEFPDNVPAWARSEHLYLEDISAVCAWVLGLREGGN